MNNDAVEVEYRLVLEHMRKDIAELKTLMGGIGKSADKEADKLDSTMKRIAGAMAGIFALDRAWGLGKHIAEVRGEFERLEVVLANTLQDQEAAAQIMERISDLAAKTPFQLNELTESYVKLTNQGFQPTMDEMTNLGDLAAHLGKSFDQLTEAVIDAQVGENERLKEFGIRAEKNGDIIKYTFKGITTEVQNNSEAIRNYILSLGQTAGVAGSMEAISKTIPGMFSNLQDAIDRMLNNIGENSEDTIKGIIATLIKLTENWEKIVNILKVVVATYGSYKAAVMVVNAMNTAQRVVQLYQAYGNLSRILKATTVAQQALNIAQKMNPVGLVIAGITAAASALLIYKNSMGDTMAVGEEFQKELTAEITKLDMVFDALDKTTEGTDARKMAVDEANKILTQYNITQLNEKSNLDDIKKAYDLVNEAIVNNIALKHQQKELDEAMNTFVESTKTAYNDLYKEIKQKGKESVANIVAADIREFAKAQAHVITELRKAAVSGTSMQPDVKDKNAKYYSELTNLANKYGLSINRVAQYVSRYYQANNVLQNKQSEIKRYYSGFITDLQNLNKQAANEGTNAAIKTIKDLENELAELQRKRNEATDINDKTELDRLAKLIADKQKEIDIFKGKNNTQEPNEFDKFKKALQQQKQEYEEYEAVKSQISKTEADKLYANLLSKAATYKLRLEQLLQQPLTKAQTGYIAAELAAIGNTASATPNSNSSDEYFKQLLESTQTYYQKAGELALQYNIDRMNLERNGLYQNIEILTQKYNAERYILQKTHGQYSWLFRELSNMSQQELKNYIDTIEEKMKAAALPQEAVADMLNKLNQAKQQFVNNADIAELNEYIDTLNKKLEVTGITEEERLQLLEELNNAENELGAKRAKALIDTATILGDLTNLASEFNSELAAIVGTAAELAGSMANVAVALATNNPVAIFSASVQMAVTLTGVVKRLKGEEQERMSVLEQQAHQLEIQQRLINDIIAKLESMHGTDKINQYQKGINALTRDIEKLNNTQLNWGMSKNGGHYKTEVSISANNIEEAYKKLMSYSQMGYGNSEAYTYITKQYDTWVAKQNELNTLILEYSEYLTGVSVDGFVDNITTVFTAATLEGKDMNTAIADNYTEVMRNAMIQQFKEKKIYAAAEEFYKRIAELSASGNSLTKAEVETLRKEYNELMNGFQKSWSVMVNNFPELFSADDIKQVSNLANEVSELLGNSSDTFTEGILDLVKRTTLEGENMVESISSKYKESMSEAMIQQFKNQHIKDAAREFYDAYYAAGNDADGLTAADINSLRNRYTGAVTDMQREFQKLTDAMPDLFGTGSDTSSKSQAGAIKNIDQPTANIIAGNTNSLLLITQAMSNKLDKLNSIDQKLGNIEKYTKETRNALTNS